MQVNMKIVDGFSILRPLRAKTQNWKAKNDIWEELRKENEFTAVKRILAYLLSFQSMVVQNKQKSLQIRHYPHFTSIGLKLVSITTILASIVTILASIKQVNTH